MIKSVYIETSSIIHNLNFWTKFICLLLILPLISFIAEIDMLPYLIGFFILILLLSKIPLLKFWKTTRGYVIPIFFGLMMLSLVFSEGTINEKLFEGLLLASRFILLILFGILFSMVTNPIEFPMGFLQVGIPHRFGVTLMVGYRMMPLLSKKISTIIDAQKSRGAEFKLGKGILNRIFSLIIPIIHSTLETSVKLSDTLLSRGYDPYGKITKPKSNFKFADILIGCICIGIMVVSFI
ncbi:energy-coupling factor transporter transmembrane protein EcfT [archaeon]|jgi:energy-coupling factor transport system permease protein|nr:energy-coupling factor transporter transmembrane protein EcfT [archaeon]MBT4351715.1 energy-coupling factor transporter transmembrane protein EcfT [archaeon]MBT4647780.1 energy-coupling factor transporter transmembrane protein EcfT [archaeon]MBT6821641.1 energy-coupling factor transporter transmembrane protein EcfT [archaeon]MBT7391831.1 energy-coupling factor transporter transmembrane protein EcfT [archaeon]